MKKGMHIHKHMLNQGAVRLHWISSLILSSFLVILCKHCHCAYVPLVVSYPLTTKVYKHMGIDLDKTFTSKLLASLKNLGFWCWWGKPTLFSMPSYWFVFLLNLGVKGIHIYKLIPCIWLPIFFNFYEFTIPLVFI